MVGASGHHGVEMDSKINGSPRSFPQLYGATFVHHLDGSPESVSSDDQFDATLRLREGTGGEFANIIVTNAPDYLYFSSNNIIYGASGITLYDLQNCTGLSEAITADPQLRMMPGTADENTLFMDPRPSSSSPAYALVDQVPDDGFFEGTVYKGAFDTDLWLNGFSWLAERERIPANPPDVNAPIFDLCGLIRGNSVLYAEHTHILACQTYVSTGGRLEIKAGTTVYAYRWATGDQSWHHRL